MLIELDQAMSVCGGGAGNRQLFRDYLEKELCMGDSEE